MKFLLTSGGLTNDSISKALFDLVGKEPKETKLVFIITAALVDPLNKSWLIRNLSELQKQNFKTIDILDISALPKSNWEPRLIDSDVIFVSGGNTHYLMYWMKKSGLADLLPELLKTRVYASISAGSIICGKDMSLSTVKNVYYEELDLDTSSVEESLHYFDFHIRPHFNNPSFPKANIDFLKETKEKVGDIIYAIDDQSALKIIDNSVEVISEGDWLKL